MIAEVMLVTQMAETRMYDLEDEQLQMHGDRMAMMRGQLNQELRGRDNLAEGLADWRFQPSSRHTAFRGEDQLSYATRSTQERALNLPIPPSSTSVILLTKSGIARTEYMLSLKTVEFYDPRTTERGYAHHKTALWSRNKEGL